jgi:MFS family permease
MQRKPLILGSLLLAAFAINLDTTIVNVVLPALVRELHASTTELEWIVDAYNLVFAALVLAAGNLGDRCPPTDRSCASKYARRRSRAATT